MAQDFFRVDATPEGLTRLIHDNPLYCGRDIVLPECEEKVLAIVVADVRRGTTGI